MGKPLGIFLALMLPVLLGLGNSGSAGAASKNPRAHGKKTGVYNLTVAGDYTGTGNGTIFPASVSMSATVNDASGAAIPLDFANLPLVNDRFLATNTFHGRVFTISGRVDIPAATDADETAAQAITGRITAILSDSSGKAARVVAIQVAASRGAGGK